MEKSPTADGRSLQPLRPLDLVWLFGLPTLLNVVATRLAMPRVMAWDVLPLEVTYFLCVGLLVLVPMFVWALDLTAREIGTYRMRPILRRMRVHPLEGREWLWAVGTFVALSAASYFVAQRIMPRLDMNPRPFFFRDMPLAPHRMWILWVWPPFFFFNIFGEEFLWRGYIQPRQELLTGRWTWLVHGLLWACWHLPMGLELIVASLPIFFILPAVVQRTGNTTVAIVVHTVFGAFGFFSLALGFVG